MKAIGNDRSLRMRILQAGAVCLSLLVGFGPAPAIGRTIGEAEGRPPIDSWEEADPASYRARGPEGLDELLEIHQTLVDRDDDTASIESLITEVAAARDAHISGLFWFTDLDKAKAAAAKTNRPILSLRMMGNLTDEYSCANSRFFRTALYANQEISEYLKSNFVLHWKSVRPVPKVTIDFGDGRVLHRTLTGNSIHYILTADGRPVDALPGLYSPQLFRIYLERGAELVEMLRENEDEAGVVIRWLHDSLRRDLVSDWEARFGVAQTELAARAAEQGEQVSVEPVDAVDAAPLAVGKSFVEARLAEEVVMKRLETLQQRTDTQMWEMMAESYRDGAILDEQSRAIVARHAGCACSGDGSDFEMTEELSKKIEQFEKAIALDTVRNEFLMHVKIHKWFADGETEVDLERLNDRVYDELFLTPSSDPWIGLVPEHIYTALEGEGIER